MSRDIAGEPATTPPGHQPRRFQFGLRALLVAMTVGGAVLGVLGILIQRTIERSRQQMAMNNMKLMGLAMHNFHDMHNAFPAHASTDPAGRPLLSWRVHILPYIEQDALYRQFHLDEPWDSPHNSTLISQMPGVYRSPKSRRGVKALGPGLTCYLAPVGNNTVFPDFPGASTLVGMRIASIFDGTSQTIMLVEAAPEQAVVWTSPDDWQFDPGRPNRGLLGHRNGGFFACMADGYVRLIPTGVSDETLRRLFDRNDGFVIKLDSLDGNSRQGSP